MTPAPEPAGHGPRSTGGAPGPAEHVPGIGAATLATVAATSGVSAATVSRVVNGIGQVAPATRRRVEEALRQHGYQRRGGRSVRAREHVMPRPSSAPAATTVDLVFARLDRLWSLEVINGVERVAAALDLQCVLTDAGQRAAHGGDWVEDVLARRPLGVVAVFRIEDHERTRLTAAGIPFVVLDPVRQPGPDVASVGCTNWNGGRAAAEHLLDLGHRRVGVITGPTGRLPSRARLDGYRSAFAAAGVAVPDHLVVEGNWKVEGGHAAARALLARADPPTAVFAGSDLHALGLYQFAGELGLRIPADLSVVGYDDLPVAAWMGPPLTTVRQPLLQMAETATRLLVDLAADRPPPSLRIELATDLVVRASTAPPR